jgi:hypothetical protein
MEYAQSRRTESVLVTSNTVLKVQEKSCMLHPFFEKSLNPEDPLSFVSASLHTPLRVTENPTGMTFAALYRSLLFFVYPLVDARHSMAKIEVKMQCSAQIG